VKLTTSFKKIAKLRHLNKVVQGSQAAGKTYSILQRWILLAVKSDNTQLCTIATDTMPNLRGGAIKDFEDICKREGVEYYRIKNPTYTFYINDWTFEFFSVDKENKGLGNRRDRLFLNEANRIPWKTARQLINRTHGERIFDFNPVSKFWAHDQFVDTGDCDFIKLTYKDNECIPEEERISIERYAPGGASPDENYWRVYGLGLTGFVEGIIYPNSKEYDKLPLGKYQSVIGVDFGWKDPLVAVMVHIDRKNKRLYWRELFYASEAKYPDFAKAIKSDNEFTGQNLFCDHAPRDIMDLRKRGLKAMLADKKGGLSSNIRRIKQYELFIHKDSTNLLRERNNYKWQMKGDDIIDYPDQSCEDHGMDAGQYGSIILLNF
jgi:phage terminase large subunit